MLSTDNHSRDSAGLRYVYPVVSRRAGGVSVGINLNVNNACNWACVYCQVEGLVRGGPPPLDLAVLESELASFLNDVLHGDFMRRAVPPEARRLVDVAFSGNGEPTSAPALAAALEIVGRVLAQHGLFGQLPVRLISNGSLMHRPAVQSALSRLANLRGELWFKIDRATPAGVRAVNQVAPTPERVARLLEISLSRVPTWVQTCWFGLDGAAPGEAEEAAYCRLLAPFADRLQGIHLYGLARPSAQPEAGRLSALPVAVLETFASRITGETGIAVRVSP